MTKLQTPPLACVFAFLVACVPPLSAESKHDLVVCATVSKNYVIGSKLVTDSGIYRRDAEGVFRHSGINFPFVLHIAFDPRDPKVCYAVSINGVLQSTDGGKSWGIGTSWDMTEPKDVCIDPSAPDHVYLALPDGVAVTTDRGATWARRETGLPDRGKYTQTIEVDRAKRGRVFAGCESGIYLTEDGAKSWRRVLAATQTVSDIQQSPHDPKLWLATTQNAGLQRSRDGGLTWEKIPGVPSAEALYNVAFDPVNARRIAVSSWTYGALTTEDGGETWTERNAGLPAEHCVFRVGIDPDSGRLFAGVYSESLYASDDFGRTWRSVGIDGSRVFSFVFVPTAPPTK